MNTTRFGFFVTALGLRLMLAGAPAFAASAAAADSTSEATPAKKEAAPSTPVPALPSEYAQREAETPHAADFKGNGAGIYIGGSTLAVVLVVVLIVVLL